MKWKIVLLAGCALLALGGIAKATGVVGQADAPAEDKEEAIVEKAIQKVEGQIEAGSARVRGARGPRGFKGEKGARGPKGSPGAPGAKGATGATGPKGTFGSIVSVTSVGTPLCGYESGVCAVGQAIALCPAGTTPISGGHGGAGVRVFTSTPYPGGWVIGATNENNLPTTLRAVVVCATP